MATPVGSTMLPQIDLSCIRRALEGGVNSCPGAIELIGGLPAWREVLAHPLNPNDSSQPDPSFRARLVERPEVSVMLSPGQSSIRLAADAVSVAVALSDELCIHELDAVRLLTEAKPLSLRKPDKDVAEVAKELFFSRRRENLLLVQEILRVHLLKPTTADELSSDDLAFRDALLRERDALFVEHNLFLNIVSRLNAGLPSLAPPTATNPRPAPPNRQNQLVNDEAVLLAECIFLLAYSVQLSSQEAVALRDMLETVARLVSDICKEQGAGARPSSRWQSVAGSSPSAVSASFHGALQRFHNRSDVFLKAQSVLHILFLSWLCCIDRSRYTDMYDPRTGESSFNLLLKDDDFIARTRRVPSIESLGDSNHILLEPVMAAVELSAAVFRLASATPNLEEIVSAVFSVCAYADALEFLSEDLVSWIDTGPGSLLPDSLLFGDVLEDFAVDLSEAPDLSNVLFRYTQEELQDTATMNSSIEGTPDKSVLYRGSEPMTSPSTKSTRYMSLTARKPPKPPSGSASGRNEGDENISSAEFAARSFRKKYDFIIDGPRNRKGTDSPRKSPKNFVALLGNFVARSISQVPSKLLCNSIGGGTRYWTGVGAESSGFISRIGDAVIDMWDAAYRQVDSDNLISNAFLDGLRALLTVLSVTAVPGGSVAHAAASLQFLCESGHPVVSIDRASQAISHYHGILTAHPSHGQSEISDAEAVALAGVWTVVANCAKSLQSHGGIEPILGRTGSDLGVRVAGLALQNISSSLRGALVSAVSALADKRAVQLFLDEAVKNKAALLRQMTRGEEAEIGVYESTIQALNLATECCKWSMDEFPSYGVEGLAVFAIDEVIAHWSHRKYSSEAERWRLVRSAVDLLLAIVRREQIESDGSMLSNTLFSKIVSPSPGTGSAGPALRAILAVAGLRRSTDENQFNQGQNRSRRQVSPIHMSNWVGDDTGTLEGREALAEAARTGDGASFRDMELAAIACSRALTFALSLSPGHLSLSNAVMSRASELITGEPSSLTAVASLVYAVDDLCTSPSHFRMGFNEELCRSSLTLLSVAASQSAVVCNILTRMDDSGSARRLRCSLAGVVASYGAVGTSDLDESAGDDFQAETESVGDDDMKQVSDFKVEGGDKNSSRLHLALHLVEACLGFNGNGRPGRYLLGLPLDMGHVAEEFEFGVLTALIELVSDSACNRFWRLDSPLRAAAAEFLERLIVNTTPATSRDVISFVRADMFSNVSHRTSFINSTVSRGLGDDILRDILDLIRDSPDDVNCPLADLDWLSLGVLTGACLTISAVFVRQYPGDEISLLARQKMSLDSTNVKNATTGETRRTLVDIRPDSHFSTHYPSPVALLHLVAEIVEHGNGRKAYEIFRKLHFLLDSRLSVHPTGKGYGAVVTLAEVCSILLDAFSTANNVNKLTSVVSEDGGLEASAMIFLCLEHIARVAGVGDSVSDDILGESKTGLLLEGTVRALAGSAEGRANSPQTRTSLYAAFLICVQLAESTVSDEVVYRTFAGRIGMRRTSGAEALVSVACRDASSTAIPAARSAALLSLSAAVRLDPLRAIPALSSQNRLRRLVATLLAEPSITERLVSSWNVRADYLQDSNDEAPVVLLSSVLSLISAVALGPGGPRALADAACLDSVNSVLHQILSRIPVKPLSDDEPPSNSASERYGQIEAPSLRPMNAHKGLAPEPMNDFDALDYVDDGDLSDAHLEFSASAISLLTAAVSTSVINSDSVPVDAVLTCLRVGKNYFARVIRDLDRPWKTNLSVLCDVCLLLYRLPQQILSAGAGPVYLKSLLACHIGKFLSPVSGVQDVGETGSPFSHGLDKDVHLMDLGNNRLSVKHPDGASLFERDVIQARIDALLHAMAALRSSAALLSLFLPVFNDPQSLPESYMYMNRSTTGEPPGRRGDLGNVARISRAALAELRRSAEEHSRLVSALGENSESLAPSRVASLAAFCGEELCIPASDVTSDIAWQCIREAATKARTLADKCVTILEHSLYILREYTFAASQVLRTPPNVPGLSDSLSMSLESAELALDGSRTSLLPLCREIDDLPSTIWGSRDPSFCRQVSRQIRTNVTLSRTQQDNV